MTVIPGTAFRFLLLLLDDIPKKQYYVTYTNDRPVHALSRHSLISGVSTVVERVQLRISLPFQTAKLSLMAGLAKSALVSYVIQITIIVVIIVACIVNLSLDLPHRDLWISLLSSCLGYALPHPKLKHKRSHGFSRPRTPPPSIA